jgi:hypothetical protein
MKLRNRVSMVEDAVLRSEYSKGIDVVAISIPHKSVGWIRQRAHRLGLATKRAQARPVEIGEIFGQLTALERISVRSKSGPIKIVVRCKCVCGQEKLVAATKLRSRRTRSCGCSTAKLISNRNRMATGYAATTQLLRAYKVGAESRQLVFELTREHFSQLILQHCHYCGATPTKTRQLCSGDSLCWNGIDRQDSGKGYMVTNVVTCCVTCNMAKRRMSSGEFLSWIRRIAQHQGML